MMPTDKEVEALADAMEQLLDDMYINGTHVCLAAKAQARVAYEPFRDKSEPDNRLMPLNLAQAILQQCDG